MADVKIGSIVIVKEVRFQSNSEYIGRQGIVTSIYPINGLISVKIDPPYNRTVTATEVRIA